LHKRRAIAVCGLVVTMAAGVLVNPSPASSAGSGTIRMETTLQDSREGFCLDVDAGTQGNVRTNVHIYPCRFGPGDQLTAYQIFVEEQIVGQPAGVTRLRNQLPAYGGTGKCLTYHPNGVGDGQSPGNAVWAEACGRSGQGWMRLDGIADQPWAANERFKAVETPYTNQELCLDIETYGTGVDLFDCHNSWWSNYYTWYAF
jgi:hypothetical protein